MLLGFYLLLIVLHVTKGCTLTKNKETSKISKKVGDAVLLPCSCDDLRVAPQKLQWKKHNNLKADWDSVPTNQDRFLLSNDTFSGNVSLLISHLTAVDNGLYRCQTGTHDYTDTKLRVEGGNTAEASNATGKAFLAFVPVGLLLLGLGGVIFWRYRAKKREQTQSSKGPTGQKSEAETQREEQRTQDITYTTVVHSNTTLNSKAVRTEERVEYGIIKLN